MGVLVGALVVVVVVGGAARRACGMLFPDQGSNPGPLYGGCGLHHWGAREVPEGSSLATLLRHTSRMSSMLSVSGVHSA